MKICKASMICMKKNLNRTGASPGTFFTVSGTARMVPAEVPKMLIGSKQSAPVDETPKAILFSQMIMILKLPLHPEDTLLILKKRF